MTDTTQPPAETLAPCPFCGSPDASMSYSATMQSPEPANRFVECGDCGSAGPYVKVAGDDAAAQALASATWNTRAALTRRAGGDAISAKEAFDAWRRAQPSGDERFPYDIAKAAFLAGRESATPKPPAGGDAGAVERAVETMRRSRQAWSNVLEFGLIAESHREATETLIDQLDEASAALALPAPVVEGE